MKKKHSAVVLNLPLPPEASAFGDAEFRTWFAAAGAELAEHRTDRLAGAVSIKGYVGIGETRRDLEKIAAQLIDILVAHGLIEEGLVCDLAMRLDRVIPSGRVRLEVKQTKPPAKRLGADARANVSRSVRARWADYRAEKVA
jgi:hypothetical protein